MSQKTEHTLQESTEFCCITN